MRAAFVGVMTVVVLAIVIVARSGGISALASGGDGSYTFISTQGGNNATEPVTYSSCRPIPVEFNLNGVDDRAETKQILLQAMGEASAASHLNIVYVGDSTRRPRPGGATMQGYPVLIAFSDADEYPAIEDNAGLGGSAYVDVNGRRTYVSGQIALATGYWNETLGDRDDSATKRAIVMHELGHVLGLGHVDDGGEIMAASGAGQHEYGPGDRRGLALLGKGPCT